MDAAVKIIQVKDQIGFDPMSLLPTRNKIVTFSVGEHGPFTEVFTYAEFNPPTVDARISNVVQTLRTTGAMI